MPVPDGREPLLVVEPLLAVLGSFTGDQPVHSGMWEGGAFGTTPALTRSRRTAWSDPTRSRSTSHRRYHLWTGPPASAMAFRHEPESPPSLIWPEDRSWFVG